MRTHQLSESVTMVFAHDNNSNSNNSNSNNNNSNICILDNKQSNKKTNGKKQQKISGKKKKTHPKHQLGGKYN